jgi:mono/diheme cytochrome c family protein
MKTINVIAGFAAVCLVAAMGFIYSGQYNIGADVPHWQFNAGLLEILREQSIDVHAKGLEVPALDDQALIAEGAEHYAPMCSGCHLAPGVENTEIRTGLYPQPRNLAEARASGEDENAGRAAARRFWIIKHGIKMSAMPAWGTSHDDKSIWAIVAFLRKLPELSPAQYQALTAAGGGHHHSEHLAAPEAPDAGADDHVQEHGDSMDTHDAETDGHHHDAGAEHAQGDNEAEPPHSH